ncbi:caspase family protein [Curvivirga aplysinae]|uniref:caspase family protein n=1 Tax=Curvivirga aplysinae TaxID=2529852 RepID=UPI001C3F5E20|nr:caspase family protein [Curvivirga aplysinae]
MPKAVHSFFLSIIYVLLISHSGHAKQMTRVEYNNWDTYPHVKLLVEKDWYGSKTSYFGGIVTKNPMQTYKDLIEECRAFFAKIGGFNESYGKCRLSKINNKRTKFVNKKQFLNLVKLHTPERPKNSPIQVAGAAPKKPRPPKSHKKPIAPKPLKEPSVKIVNAETENTEVPETQTLSPKPLNLSISSAHSYKSDPNPASIAVIIGNKDYTTNGQDIPDVTPAQNDGLIFKNFAMENLGVHEENIIYLNNATKAEIERVFGNERTHQGRAYSWVREGRSDLYVYYAGHGAPGPDGEAYLVPVNATADTIHLDGYPLDLLYKNLSQIHTKSTTVILESCFSGNSNAGSVIRNASPVFMNTEETTIPPKLNVITAGSTNQLASWKQDKENSLFTYHYIKGMKGEADGPLYGNEDGQVSMSELQAYMDDTVTYWAKRYYNRKQNVQITVAR